MWSEDPANAQQSKSAEDEKEMAPTEDAGMKSPTRRRSLSVPSRNEATNVETVVTKAKRAGSYLWMLLHAQVGFC